MMSTPRPSEYSCSGVSDEQKESEVENLHLRFRFFELGTFRRLIIFSVYQCDKSAIWIFLETGRSYGKWYFKQTDRCAWSEPKEILTRRLAEVASIDIDCSSEWNTVCLARLVWSDKSRRYLI